MRTYKVTKITKLELLPSSRDQIGIIAIISFVVFFEVFRWILSRSKLYLRSFCAIFVHFIQIHLKPSNFLSLLSESQAKLSC